MPKLSPELNEKDFIQESYSKDPFSFWLWLIVSLLVLLVFWIGSKWYNAKKEAAYEAMSFLQVTNRELSLFLWQNPEFMRVNARDKEYYLPGFNYIGKINADIVHAEEYAVATPEVFLRYHAWNALIKNDFIPTSIPANEFAEFLRYDEQWQPRYWLEAPESYKTLVEELNSNQYQDLSLLSVSELPSDVRIAFQGWQNFFKEGEALNQLKPTIKQLELFLENHPCFARNCWSDILKSNNPNYLISLEKKEQNPELIIPSNELTSFLRFSLYNYLTLQKPSR